MFFDTPVYFVFLSLVVLIYWRLSRYQQNIFLLAASYIFYAWWDWRFLILIAISTLVDFYCAKVLAVSRERVRRHQILILSVGMNLTFLGFFKYFNFFIDSFIDALTKIGLSEPNTQIISILLPPGISFYTFQAIAYMVDVYYRRLEPATSLVDYTRGERRR